MVNITNIFVLIRLNGGNFMDYDAKLLELDDFFGNWVGNKSAFPGQEYAKLTNSLYPYKELFSPIKVNKTVIKNRVVMGPMGNLMMCEETGRPNQKMLE